MITAAARAANRQREFIGRTRRECPICGSLHLEYEFLMAKSPVCGCQTCGLLFLNPEPENGRASGQAETPRAEKFARISEAHAKETIRQLIEYSGSQSGRLLVIGADPQLDSTARQQGFETFSYSMNELNAGAELPAAADLCILFCSLERVPDPLGLLVIVQRILGDKGCLMVVSSTTDSKAARQFRSSWWEFNRGNRFYFSVDTLQNLLLKAGFGDPIIMPDRGLEPGRTKFLIRPKAVPAVPLLSVIVPVYNERATFVVMMDQLLQKSIEGVDIEVIVIESNSTDGTREEVRKYLDHPRVRIILEDKPKGKGAAVRAGLAIARGDIILFQDADLEYDLNDYEALLAPLLRFEANFVLGSRHSAMKTTWKIRKFTDSPALAAYFNLGHVLFLALFNFIYKQSLTDPFTMYKVFRRDCIWGLTFECDLFDFDNEIVIKLVRKGYRPLELPVNYVSRSIKEGKKIKLVRDAVNWLRALIRFRNTPLYGGHAEIKASPQ